MEKTKKIIAIFFCIAETCVLLCEWFSLVIPIFFFFFLCDEGFDFWLLGLEDLLLGKEEISKGTGKKKNIPKKRFLKNIIINKIIANFFLSRKHMGTYVKLLIRISIFLKLGLKEFLSAFFIGSINFFYNEQKIFGNFLFFASWKHMGILFSGIWVLGALFFGISCFGGRHAILCRPEVHGSLYPPITLKKPQVFYILLTNV